MKQLRAFDSSHTAWVGKHWHTELTIFWLVSAIELSMVLGSLIASQGINLFNDNYVLVSFCLALGGMITTTFINDLVFMATSKPARVILTIVSIIATVVDIAFGVMATIGLGLIYKQCIVDLTCEFQGVSTGAYIASIVFMAIATVVHIAMAITKVALLRNTYLLQSYLPPVFVRPKGKLAQ